MLILKKIPITFLICLVCSVFLLSCGTSRDFGSPYSTKNPSPEVDSLSSLAAVTEKRAPNQPIFWARTDVTLHDQVENRKYRFDATMIFGEPDKMRIRGNHFIAGNLFEIIVDGSESFVYLAKDRTLYEGTTRQLQQSGGIFGSLSARELIDSIRVFHGLNDVLNSNDPIRMTETKKYIYIISEKTNQTVVRKIRKQDGLIEEVLLLDPNRDNKIVLKAQYWKYKFFGDEDQPFPTDLDISLPEYDVNVRLEVNDIKLDPPIRLDVIPSLPRRIDSRFPLEALQYQESVLPEEQ